MTNAIVTVSIGAEYAEIAGMTVPLMQRYANKLGAQFECISNQVIDAGSLHCEKFQLLNLLSHYDRVLFLDIDLIIRPECPNLFDLVPPDSLGAFLVHTYTDYHDRSIGLIQDKLGDIGWRRTYFNSGVLVLSSRHRDIFDLSAPNALGPDFFFDQTQLNYQVQKLGIPVFDIGYRFNHTTAPKNSEDRFESYIIHYPGRGHRAGNKIEQIRLDLWDLGLEA